MGRPSANIVKQNRKTNLIFRKFTTGVCTVRLLVFTDNWSVDQLSQNRSWSYASKNEMSMLKLARIKILPETSGV